MRVIRVQGSKARDFSWVPQEGLRKLSISMSGNYLPFIPPSSSPVPDTTRLQIPSACSSSLVAGPNLATADELHVWLVTPTLLRLLERYGRGFVHQDFNHAVGSWSWCPRGGMDGLLVWSTGL